MKKIVLFIISLFIGFEVCSAQKAEQTFPITGKPILTVFTNYKAGLGNVNNVSGFNLDRAFVGYEGFFAKGFSAKIVMNVETQSDDNGNTKFNGYLKNAQVDWRGYVFFVSAGLVNLKQFSEQENCWGHRYVFKSFQEEYGIVFCEDIGLVAGYEFSPVISADIAFTNGEGRKFKNMDNRYKYGAGITLKPLKGLILRLYGDIYDIPKYLEDNMVKRDKQYSIASFAGYANKYFSIGAEYNRVFNYKFDSKQDANGYSAYTTINITPKMHIYGRFDYFDTAGNMKYDNEGHAIICGFEYSPIKQIRISPNYQSWKSSKGKRENFLLLSVECKI
ncbi:hypothetical protein [Bacteroides acidifaciens]|jgi:hypothetical protein|uniref:hypothetical protein n=1 Tax=Bacteroides acidifaciens TaxID=85831 RepID=UPI002582B0E8|nr:hypothetical protein [Bacteroides acidifaciens]